MLAKVGTLATLAAAMARALSPPDLENVGARADEGDAGGSACRRERRVLGKEPIARVDRVSAGPDCSADDRIHIEIGAAGVAATTDFVGLVGLESVL